MNYSLAVRNIVLVGAFQPSKYDKYFFITNKIVEEKDILPGSLFNTDIVQLITSKFSLLILMNQVVISSNNPSEKGAVDKVIDLVAKSEPVCTALGINFHWNIKEEKSLEEVTSQLFYNPNNKLINSFFNEKSVYGLYVSKDLKDCRLKLDIKPQVISEPNKEESYVVNFAFNFHCDIKNATQISERLTLYDEYYEESKKIMAIYG